MHRFENVTGTNDVLGVIPEGRYRAILSGQDAADNKIYQVNVTFTIKS